ncbi:heme exporter protein CcmB [Bosea vestrisii]|uniref:heme exporter protein CcmB n=1 Tax=Bosea vestrisii TaxID=151416 RepID=UPI0024DFED4F|nr:heme exporter protein CcmB [Bosea vestrisii]WID94305.1 heme exporter protein CcmB [Bosea vestrisii]
MRRAFLAILKRDLALAVKAGGGGELALVFFLTVVVLIPFALGPDLNLLSRIGPAILWLGALLATLIGLDRLFQADEEDGSLDLIRGAGLPLEFAVFAKALAHWLTTGLPLTLAAPLLGLLVALPAEGVLPLAASLALGTPALSFIGTAAAALTASLRRGGLILPILVAPLTVPVLIFGVSASSAVRGPMSLQSPLLILAALSLMAAAVGCVAAAAALRQPD